MPPRKTATKTPAAEPGVLFIRNVPADTIADLDAWAVELRAERGVSVSRTDVVREIVHRAVIDRRAKAKSSR